MNRQYGCMLATSYALIIFMLVMAGAPVVAVPFLLIGGSLCYVALSFLLALPGDRICCFSWCIAINALYKVVTVGIYALIIG